MLEPIYYSFVQKNTVIVNGAQGQHELSDAQLQCMTFFKGPRVVFFALRKVALLLHKLGDTTENLIYRHTESITQEDVYPELYE